MQQLPDTRRKTTRDLLHMMVLSGLESVTRSLLRGDAHDLELLRLVAHRARALADAFDARVTHANHVGDLEGEPLTTERKPHETT